MQKSAWSSIIKNAVDECFEEQKQTTLLTDIWIQLSGLRQAEKVNGVKGLNIITDI